MIFDMMDTFMCEQKLHKIASVRKRQPGHYCWVHQYYGPAHHVERSLTA